MYEKNQTPYSFLPHLASSLSSEVPTRFFGLARGVVLLEGTGGRPADSSCGDLRNCGGGGDRQGEVEGLVTAADP